jgi:hypothetical protein
VKKNIFWAAIFACVVLLSAGVIFFGQLGKDGKGAEIYIGGELYKTIESIDDAQIRTLEIKTDGGYNLVCYGGGKIWVSEADCANQTCVKYAKASFAGETIVCAPHKLVVKVVGRSGSQVDAAV